MAEIWRAGTLYQPGSVVLPATPPPVPPQSLTNGNFADGDDNWTLIGYSVENEPGFDGADWRATNGGAGTSMSLVNDTEVVASPGQTCSASYMVQGIGGDGDARNYLRLYFYDSDDALISTVESGRIKIKECRNQWRKHTISATAPANTAYFKVGARNDGRGGHWWLSDFRLTSVHVPLSTGLLFTAVQAASGFSAAIEPVWPSETGIQVVDNEVTWEAIDGERVVWTAERILVSGATEPTWPGPGSVVDNTILWQQDDRRVEDQAAPNSKVVALAASKIFAADDDIVPFCATVDPLDWSTADDAGYLPFGLQNYGNQPDSRYSELD